MKPTRKHLALIIAALAIAGGVAAVTAGPSQPEPAAAAQEQRTEVEVAQVQQQTINQWHEFSGRLEAVDRVDIRPMVPGTITAIHFTDGVIVKKGDRLFSLDARPYAAAVERARAEVEAAQTNALYAKEEADRASRLLAADALAKKSYDEKRNAARETQARLTAAQAALKAAQVDLGYTEIVAPITGRVSRAELTVGNAVNNGANATKLTTIVSVNPIYAAFNVDEGVYLRNLRKLGTRSVPVEVALADEQGYPHKGEIFSIDNQMDAVTGTIRVRAKLKNDESELVPGLFAKVRIGSASDTQAVLVDDAAIGTDQNKKFVFVVSDDQRVQYRPVTVGDLHEGKRIVLEGLKDGEDIIVNGIQRVQPNDKVQAKKADLSLTSAQN